MIRRRRGPEPVELAQVRSWRLARALLYPSAATAAQTEEKEDPTSLGYNLQGVRDALRVAQRGRCAYCSTAKIEADYYDLEHFRPRAVYWWLTWTWENLWLTCPICQGKSSAFPLEVGAAPLAAPTPGAAESGFALSTERPQLLDPARDVPHAHLKFEACPETRGGWYWAAITERGHETRRLLSLKRRARLTDYEDVRQHVQRRLRPAVEAIGAALAAGDVEAARAAWDQCGDDFLWRQADYLVASWWYLLAAFEEHGLAAHGMQMWLFPDDALVLPTDPTPFIDGHLPNWLSAEARLHALYIGGVGRAPKARVEAAISAICGCRACSVDELVELLGREKATLDGYLRPMVRDGRLRPQHGRYACPTGAAAAGDPAPELT